MQHLLRCGECGRNFHARSTWTTTSVRNGKKYRYHLPTPHRYYMCNGMQSLRLPCREQTYIRAERLEEPIWSEVKRVIRNPNLIVAGIIPLDSHRRAAGWRSRSPGLSETCGASRQERNAPSRCSCRGRSPRPSSTISASSSLSDLRTSGRSWTITVPGRRATLRNYG